MNIEEYIDQEKRQYRKKIFGETIRELIIRKGYSLRALSEISKINRTSLSNYQNGKTLPCSDEMARMLFEPLGLNYQTLEDFFEDNLVPVNEQERYPISTI